MLIIRNDISTFDFYRIDFFFDGHKIEVMYYPFFCYPRRKGVFKKNKNRKELVHCTKIYICLRMQLDMTSNVIGMNTIEVNYHFLGQCLEENIITSNTYGSNIITSKTYGSMCHAV